LFKVDASVESPEDSGQNSGCSMKLLAFSDVVKWEGYEELVDRIRPDVVALAGDLTSDGFAAFWSKMEVEALKKIPECKQLLTKYAMHKADKSSHFRIGVVVHRIGGAEYTSTRADAYPNFWFELDSLVRKYWTQEVLTKFRKRTHVNRFYDFLRYAGKRSKVVAVKGDHDADFKGDYIPEKIDRIEGCREISGRVQQVKGFRFLGLGYDQTHYLRTLRPMIDQCKREADVVLTHCEQDKVHLLSLLEPRLIVRGHFGSGRYLVNGVPSVFTMGAHYTVVELGEGIPRIKQYVVSSNDKTKELGNGSCRPWFTPKGSEFERYKWLKPYPRQQG
jgi:Icc-related predicted phosphoesterase